MAAAVVIGSLKIPSHLENGRLLVNNTLPTFVALGQQGKQDFHLLTALLDVAHLVDDQAIVFG